MGGIAARDDGKKLEVHIKRLNKELTEKGEEERVVEEGEKIVCIRCGVEVPDGKGPGSTRICGGCGGGECRVKEVEGEKAVLIQGFFSRAAEEVVEARDETVNAQTGLEKPVTRRNMKISTLLSSRRTRSTERRCCAGSQALANKGR